MPPAVHWVAYAILAGAMAWILASRYAHPLLVREPIDVASETSLSPFEASLQEVSELSGLVAQRIDPNEADWTELTRLPGIGETLAKRIVAYRQEHRTHHPDGTGQSATEPVFRGPDDLQAVRGIGPKTAERIAPLLTFPETPATQPASGP